MQKYSYKFEPEQLLRPYYLIKPLGNSEISETWYAEHIYYQYKKAIKIPTHPEYIKALNENPPDLLPLKHSGIVAIQDIKAYKSNPFLIMDFIDGRDLRTILNQQSIIPFDMAMDISRKVLSILEYAHSEGIYHHCLNPANIFICQDGSVKITDFFLGVIQAAIYQKIHNAKQLSMTDPLPERLVYMPSEQYREDIAGSPSDIYAAGLIMFEMLSGFADQTKVKTELEKRQIPEEISRIITQATESFDDRYVSVSDMKRDLLKSIADFTEISETGRLSPDKVSKTLRAEAEKRELKDEEAKDTSEITAPIEASEKEPQETTDVYETDKTDTAIPKQRPSEPEKELTGGSIEEIPKKDTVFDTVRLEKPVSFDDVNENNVDVARLKAMEEELGRLRSKVEDSESDVYEYLDSEKESDDQTIAALKGSVIEYRIDHGEALGPEEEHVTGSPGPKEKANLEVSIERLMQRLQVEPDLSDRQKILDEIRSKIKSLESRGLTEKALAVWKKFLILFPDDDTIVSEILRLQKQLKPRSSRRHTKSQISEKDDGSIDNFRSHALLLEENGKYEEALKIWYKIMDEIPGDGQAKDAASRLIIRIEELKPQHRSWFNLQNAIILFGLIIVSTIVGIGVYYYYYYEEPLPVTIVTEKSMEPEPAVIPSPTIIISENMFIFPTEPKPLTPTPTPIPPDTPLPRRKPIPKAPPGYVFLPAGVYYAISEDDLSSRLYPQVEIHRIENGFFISQTELTQSEWEMVIPENPSRFNAPNRPVERVSFYDAVAYCNRRSSKEGLTPCYYRNPQCSIIFNADIPISQGPVYWNKRSNGYRLPTEEEWEYACRAGTSSKYWWGDRWDCSKGMAENDVVAAEDECASFYNKHGLKKDATAVVRLFPPNPWGLYEMHGNVQEWCWDILSTQYVGKIKYSENSVSEPRRALRGGSWNHLAYRCSSGSKDYAQPDFS
ncbi:SUMF1/EgtB/PvdO family nonheme iron enzyme, partial [bacterium]|nr:SUMF1/EgtB/PvdO family nonheme iron enzyme [candidate division CSSED10-310 bacterium]